MSKVYVYEDGCEPKEVTAEHAIGIMVKDLAVDPKLLLDLLRTQNTVNFRGLTISYEGDYPDEWEHYV